MTNKIVIYSKKICPFCVRAKDLLKSKGLNYTEINVENSEKDLMEMIEKSGNKRTVPQIFINGHHIGGYDDLSKANKTGKLD